MDFREFGSAGSPRIVLIPGSMMCWKQFDRVIPLRQNMTGQPLPVVRGVVRCAAYEEKQ